MSAACCVRPPLKEARAQRERGEISAEALKAIEDREIERIIARQEAARPALDHRRRVPPRLLELRLPRPARRRRGLSGRAQDQVPGPAAQADDAARGGQARLLQRASDDRAFQVRRSAHQGDAEDDDPVAVVAALPLRPRRGAGGDLSGDGRLLPRPRRELPQGGARLRGRRLPLSAARRGQLHLSVRPQAARAGEPIAATIRASCRTSMRA